MNKIEKITSRDNRRLVHARKVRDGKVKDEIFIEGKRLVAEALRSDVSINHAFVIEGFRDRELITDLQMRPAEVVEVPEKLFSSIAGTTQPQGVILIAARPKASSREIDEAMASAGVPIAVYLCEINNPSNLGAIFRTSDAADIAGIILSPNSSDGFAPKAIRAGMGSNFRLAIWENVPMVHVVDWAQTRRMSVVAAVTQGGENYLDTDWKRPTLLVLGSEAHGLSEDQLGICDKRVRIPLKDGVESLNIAVAAGVLLFEARRQVGCDIIYSN